MALTFILIAGVIVRSFGLFRPLLGNFATKNIVYAMIADNFCFDPTTILKPTLNVLINGQKALHMTEWPFFSYFAGSVYKLLPFLGLDATGRVLNIILFTLSGLFVYMFVKDVWGEKPALLSSFFYMFFPLGIIYGQSFQIEASIALCIASIFYLISSWLTGKRSALRAFCLWLGISLLLLMKIQMICLALPVFVLLISDERGRQLFRLPLFYVFCLLCLVLPVAWYKYTYVVSGEYDNVFFSVLYSVKIRSFPDPRIFTIEFYSKIAYTFIRNVFSPLGALLVLGGTILTFRDRDRKSGFIVFYFLAMCVYFILMPRKVYEMDYYYIPLLLPGAIAAAAGLMAISRVWLRRVVLLFFFSTSLLLAWNPSYKTTENESYLHEIGAYADSILPQDAKVIVCSEGNQIGFLYYTNRDGFMLPVSDISYTDLELKARQELELIVETSPERLFDKYVDEGAEYFICDNEEWLREANPVLYEYILSERNVRSRGESIIVTIRGRDF